MELSTVAWFLSSYSTPISFSERFVSERIRYIDTCRAMAVLRDLFCPRRSSSRRE